MIIDIHTHLGDLLYPNGGRLIEQTGVKKNLWFDMNSVYEFFSHPAFNIRTDSWIYRQIIKGEIARNNAATRENLRREMDANGVSYSVVLPVPPNVTFADMKAAADKDPGIIPFTGVDFTSAVNFETQLADAVANGAKGLKLHPILQRVALTDARMFHTVEAFAPFDLPILFHSGISVYYLKPEEKVNENPEYGQIHYARDLVHAFPNVKFIAGHAGLDDAQLLMTLLGEFKNVWVDISFQSPKRIRQLIETFGAERVLYASDWPWGYMRPAIRCVKKACKGDKGLERRLFYENAAELLNLTV